MNTENTDSKHRMQRILLLHFVMKYVEAPGYCPACPLPVSLTDNRTIYSLYNNDLIHTLKQRFAFNEKIGIR